MDSTMQEAWRQGYKQYTDRNKGTRTTEQTAGSKQVIGHPFTDHLEASKFPRRRRKCTSTPGNVMAASVVT